MTGGFIERKRPTGDPRCGTSAGNSRHIARGEAACEPCRAAKAEYDRRRLAAPEHTQKNRLFAKAQRLALADLRTAFPEMYRAQYIAHRDALLAQAGLS